MSDIYLEFLNNKHELLNSYKIKNLIRNTHKDVSIIKCNQPVMIYLIRFKLDMNVIDEHFYDAYEKMTFLIISNYKLLTILHIKNGYCMFYKKYYCDYDAVNCFINRIENEALNIYGFDKYAKLCKIMNSLELEECNDDLKFADFIPRTTKSSSSRLSLVVRD